MYVPIIDFIYTCTWCILLIVPCRFTPTLKQHLSHVSIWEINKKFSSFTRFTIPWDENSFLHPHKVIRCLKCLSGLIFIVLYNQLSGSNSESAICTYRGRSFLEKDLLWYSDDRPVHSGFLVSVFISISNNKLRLAMYMCLFCGSLSLLKFWSILISRAGVLHWSYMKNV
jgi:hypothetical protein